MEEASTRSRSTLQPYKPDQAYCDQSGNSLTNSGTRQLYRNLTKTLDYLDIFARFKDEENIKAVERLLNSHTELEMFERSQLGK